MFKKLLKIFRYLSLVPFALIIIVISKFYLIRFFFINSTRIGHFICEPEIYLCEKKRKLNIPNNNYIDIAFIENKKNICNKYVYKILKKKFLFLSGDICFPIINIIKIIDKFFKTDFISNHIIKNTNNDLDIHNLFSIYPHQLSINKEDLEIGFKYLKVKGLTKKSKFVCLIVRDENYLLKNVPSKNFAYHKFRNNDIDLFNETIKELVNRDYYVFRMGRDVKNKLSIAHPKVIDYAISKDKSDFLDVFLGAYCEFCLTTCTGYDAVPHVFRKPLASLIVPLGQFYSYNNNQINITKKHYSKKLKKILTLSEIFELGLAFSKREEDFKKENIELIPYEPEDIKKLTIEMISLLNNNFQIEKNYNILNDKFINLFKTKIKTKLEYSSMHGRLIGRFGNDFLKNNDWLMK